MHEAACSLAITLPSPFSVERTVEHVRTSSYGVAYRAREDAVLERPMTLAGRPALVSFRFHADGDGAWLEVTVTEAEDVGEERLRAAVEEAMQRARFMFGVDDALTTCYAALSSDPLMGRLINAFHGLRMVRAPDLYEALLIAIVGQQVSVASAQALRRRLMDGLGSAVEIAGTRWPMLPPAEALAEATPERLRDLGMSRQKAVYLREMGRRTADGDLRAESFHGLSDEEATARLVDCPGIGRWTAEVALMRGLGRMDAFPAGDIGLQNAVQRLLHLDARPAEKALRALGERWAGWRSYATLYLWTSLRAGGFG